MGPSPSCGHTTACNGGLDLGYISGDAYGDVVAATGWTSYWIKLQVGEDSWSGAPLKFKATLTSPPGVNFDMFVHTNKGGGCATAVKRSTNVTGVDTVSYYENDVTLGDDDYPVGIEVRAVSGECASTAKWHLKVEGNRY